MRRLQLNPISGFIFFAALLVAVVGLTLASAGPSRARAQAPAETTRETDPGAEPEARSDREEEEEGHRGFLSRISLGLGFGIYSLSGRADPIPGVEVLDDLSHGGPALNLSLDWGFGIIENLALHIGPVFETVLTSGEDSSVTGFYLLGLGGGLSYYFMPLDLYLTGQVRWMNALLYLPDAPCGFLGTGKLWGYDGIEFSLAFGKEWFGDDEDDWGIGIGLQLNYAYLADSPSIHYFSILLAPTLTSF